MLMDVYLNSLFITPCCHNTNYYLFLIELLFKINRIIHASEIEKLEKI